MSSNDARINAWTGHPGGLAPPDTPGIPPHRAAPSPQRPSPPTPGAVAPRTPSLNLPPSLRSGSRPAAAPPPPSAGLPQDPYHPVNAALDAAARPWKGVRLLILSSLRPAMPTSRPAPRFALQPTRTREPEPMARCQRKCANEFSGAHRRTLAPALEIKSKRRSPRHRKARTISQPVRSNRAGTPRPDRRNEPERPHAADMHERFACSARTNPAGCAAQAVGRILGRAPATRTNPRHAEAEIAKEPKTGMQHILRQRSRARGTNEPSRRPRAARRPAAPAGWWRRGIARANEHFQPRGIVALPGNSCQRPTTGWLGVAGKVGWASYSG
jgi:hypothetical protein